MKPLLIFTSLAFALPAALPAQQAPEHAPDGGTHQQMQSVVIAPIPNAPFSSVVVTEWTHILPDGSKQTTWNHRIVARDSSGRVFQERRYFSPTGKTTPTPLSKLQYDDPNRHERILCDPPRAVIAQSGPQRSSETCSLFPYEPVIQPETPNPTLPALVTLPNKTTIQREDLGRQSIEGVDALGSREITTIPAGLIGNEKAQPIVKEFWYSPRLGINIVTKRFDPRVSSIQNITLTQINLGEPDPKLFTPAPDAHIERQDR